MSFILNPSRFSTGGGADPGLALLESATLWLDASDAVSGAQWLRNKGTGGRALDARVGSVGSAQIINGALKLPGLTGNSASTPDAAALDITGDLEMVFRAAPISWTVTQTLGGKWSGPGQKSYILYTEASTGKLWFWLSADGSTGIGALSSTGVSFGAGVAGWVKVTYRFSDKRVQFFTAADQASEPSSWTQLGTDVTHTIASATFNSTAPMWVGADTGTTNLFNGSIFRAIVRNGIGGTTVFDADFTAQSTLATSFTESSSNAATVTINSTSGVDTNDPLLLPHTGTNYLYLPGLSGNYASAPDSAPLSLTGDMDIIARVSLLDWTPSASNAIVVKGDTSTQDSYTLRVLTSGLLELQVWNSSGGLASASSSVAPTVTDGGELWVRATVDVDNGANSVFKFYTSPDGTTWTQLGTTQTSTRLTSVRDGTSALFIGCYSNGVQHLSGSVYRVRILNGYDGAGSVVFDADFTANTNQSSFTESSSNAATVTINRSASGRKAVMVVRPTLLFGTDDYLEVADNALLEMDANDPFTVLAVFRRWGDGAPTGVGFIASKQSTTTGTGYRVGYDATTDSATIRLSGTNSQDLAPTRPASGTRAAVTAVRSGGGTLETFLSATTNGTTTDSSAAFAVTNSDPFFVGRLAGGTAYYVDAEVDHIAVFKGTALDATAIGQIMSYLGVS